MVDLHYVDFGRGNLCNRTVLSELMVGCHSSPHALVRGSACCFPGLVEAHCQLSETSPIADLILSEASHTMALVWSELTVDCQSLQV